MITKAQLVESLVVKCLADNQVPAEPKTVTTVTNIFLKAGNRVLTAAHKSQLTGLGISCERATMTHAETVEAGLKSKGVTTLANCANAFVFGISEEFMALRAPLRAFAVTANVPKHSPAKSKTYFDPTNCRVCGYDNGIVGPYSVVELVNGLLSAGIHGRVDDLYNAAQTLFWFTTLPTLTPSKKHVAPFENVLKAIAESPGKSSCNSLAKDLADVLDGDKYRRLYVIETLGYCGVLNTKLGEPILDAWINRKQILEHPHKFNEAESPACFWKREFGFNGARFRELFPAVKLPKSLDGPMT